MEASRTKGTSRGLRHDGELLKMEEIDMYVQYVCVVNVRQCVPNTFSVWSLTAARTEVAHRNVESDAINIHMQLLMPPPPTLFCFHPILGLRRVLCPLTRRLSGRPRRQLRRPYRAVVNPRTTTCSRRAEYIRL